VVSNAADEPENCEHDQDGSKTAMQPEAHTAQKQEDDYYNEE
jgi:hypothetical protein